jgi:bifunctional UDP-N-acetylglucosamine pyrophosphorylase/glucosamine-1-phosphate N-acetyltransferase
MKNFACVILAAGKGKRMKSNLTKVLHPICGKVMLFYIMDVVRQLDVAKTVVVVGRQREKVMDRFRDWNVTFVNQTELLGTGDAVLRTENALDNIEADILVVAGDTPLLSKETVEKMMVLHLESDSDITLLSTFLDEPGGYGRIVRDKDEIVGIVEERDATHSQKEIKEINAGVYIFNREKLFKYLKEIEPDNVQKEYYLTDIVRLIGNDGGNIRVLTIDDWRETIGINDRWTMSIVSGIMERRVMEKMAREGVTFISPETTYIEYGVEIGKDTVIEPFVSIKGKSVIGEGCNISSHTTIVDSTVGNNVRIKENCLIEEAHVSDEAVVNPFSMVRNEEEKEE